MRGWAATPGLFSFFGYLGSRGASKALLQRDLEALVAVAVAKLVEHVVRFSAVRPEKDAATRGMSAEQIVHAERDRGLRARTIFDERGHVGAAIVVRIEFV